MIGSLSRAEQRIAVLAKLARRRHIGMDYTPVQKALGRIPAHARDDIPAVLDELYREGLIRYHKNKDCISIAPGAVGQVVEMIADEVPDYVLERLQDRG